MNKALILYTLGIFLIILAGILVIPLGLSYLYEDTGNLYKDGEAMSFTVTIALCLALGVLARIIFRAGRDAANLSIVDGFFIVIFTWLTIALFGALPFYLTGACSFSDAYFESMSGFTTTGASILTHPSTLPHGLLFWRSFTHWFGGIGIIVLALAVLPAFGIGGYQLFRMEGPGGGFSATKLKPRFTEVARIVWGVYLLLTVLEIVLLLLGGLPLFDAVTHAFATVATGGFSTKDGSIADFKSSYITYVIMVFMFLSACNFQTHYLLLRGQFRQAVKDPQLKSFVIMLALATAFISITIFFPPATNGALPRPTTPAVEQTVRDAAFQVTSCASCTGFTTANFNEWADPARLILLLMMMIGGCAGSTTGGIKQIRIIILLKSIARAVKQMVKPHQVIPIKVGGMAMDETEVSNIRNFFFLYLTLFFLATLLLTILGIDLVSSIASVVSCMGGVGPGLGVTALDYSAVPLLGKWILVVCMLAGRLEIFVLIVPFFWKK
ncbi:MAG: TrkH family potassium uptake protein [Planctomycetes bacterium]|nr:TrkH family potassium uptake protein [Planctomycetota bacterium]